MKKIKKGDDVIVITGKDKGRTGTVLEVTSNDRILVEGINMVKKHVKPNPNAGEAGGIQDKTMPLHISNVQLYNPKTKKGDRVAIQISDDGSKKRVFRSNNEAVDV
ncbi:MAG: 50S ribosomal protein L24 [Woeseiaceae bacterium]